MLGVALLSSALLALADARIYGRCELARDLLSFGVRKEHLATWVCIAFHESRFDTAARNPYSGDHGILQISELYWCGAGKACGLPCSALRDDDISDDVECAFRIHEEHTRLQGNGFLAWVVYPQHCKHNAKKYLADCESSLKTPPVRTDGRARVLKPQNRNVTSVSNYPQIDELLPPYLTIGSVFSGNYEKEFEQNYNNKVKIDWLNYKIDNIDELKLPVFNQKVIGEYPTTTLATIRRRPTTTRTTTTTTTTTESPLPKIKPPSPRRIESNSFRRKKLRPIFNSVNFIDTTESSTILSSKITPGLYISTIENYSKQHSLPHFEDNFGFTTTTIKPSTKKYEYSAFASVASAVRGTTKFPIVYTEKPILTTIVHEVSTATTESSLSTKDQNSMISVNQNLLDDKIKSSVSDKPIDSTSTLSSTSKAPSTTTKNDPFRFYKSQISSTTPRTTTITTTWKPWTRSWSNWRTTSKYTTTTSTSKPFLSTRRTQNTSSTTAAPAKEEISLKVSKPQSTTTESWVKTRPWFEFRVPTTQPTKLSGLDNNTKILEESTTLRPPSTSPTFYVRSRTTPTTLRTTGRINSTITSFSTTSRPFARTTTTSGTPRTTTVTTAKPTVKTTARPTQSIFDLYLRPTKRPSIPPFSLSPFGNGGLSLKIFAGGTTTIAPKSSRSDDTKTLAEETAKDEKKTLT